MRLHPAISIIFGIITAVTIFKISTLIFGGTSWIVIIGFTALIGGFIANYFAKFRKIRYGTYAGIAIMLISLGTGNYILPLDIWALVILYFIPIMATIGSFIGEMTNKKDRQNIKREYQRHKENNIKYGIYIVFLVLSFAIFTFFHCNSTVTIQSSGFDPSYTSMYSTGTVTWINKDTKIHRIVSDDGLFDSGNLSPGQNYTYNFTGYGEFTYHCSIDPSIQGFIRIAMIGDDD